MSHNFSLRFEGSGKTTQLKHVTRFLKKIDKPYIVTREPGGTDIGIQIRSILLNSKNKNIDAYAELLLYVADRVQHAREVILPGLAANKLVLCDRFFDATTAYQGYARGLDIALILKLHQLMLDNLTPDLTLLFDLPPKIGLSRAWKQINQKTRSATETRFEEEAISFHEKVRAGYLTLARAEPKRFKIINAAPGENQVRRAIIKTLKKMLNL
jgi:dTMP kinase